jgi:hypothetical protein
VAYRDAAQLHVDVDLTQISAGFPANTGRYLGNLIAPFLRVDKQSDRYRIFNRDVWGRPTEDKRAPAARANELPPMTLSRDSYFTTEHSLVDRVPREQEANADAGLDALGDATERLSNTIMLNRELATLTAAFDVNNFCSDFKTTLSGADQWNNYSTSDPVTDFKTGVDAVNGVLFENPTFVIMGYNVFRKLEDHPKILARMIGAPLAVTSGDVMQRIFGLPPITVATAGYVNAAWGAPENVVRMVGNDVLLGYNNEGNLRVPNFMRTFTRPVASGDGELMPTEREYDWDTKSDKVRTSIEYDLKFITVDDNGDSCGAAYLIKDAVA